MSAHLIYHVRKSRRTRFSPSQNQEEPLSHRIHISPHPHHVRHLFCYVLQRTIRRFYFNHCIIPCMLLPLSISSHHLRNIYSRHSLLDDARTLLHPSRTSLHCWSKRHHNIPLLETHSFGWSYLQMLAWQNSC